MAVKTDALKRKTARAVRVAVLAGILIFMTTVGVLHQSGLAVKPAGVDALCPFGGLESAWSLISQGSLVSKVAWSSFALLGAVLLSALLFRRSFCGNVCPLGTLQEGAGWLGKKILKRRLMIPKAVDKWARWLKAGVLALAIIMTARTASLFIRPADPWATWMHISSAELFVEFWLGLIVLALSLAGSFLYDRFFCKYLCPMGAALTPFSRIGLFKVRRDPKACIDCKACDKACPMNIEVSKAEAVVSGECVDCDLCVNACPVPGALEIRGLGKAKLSSLVRVLVTLGIFIVVILAAQFTGLAPFSQTSLEHEFGEAEAAAAIGLAIDEGESEGEMVLTAEEGTAMAERAEAVSSAIKGSDTWASVMKVSGIPAEAFMERFPLSEADLAVQLKNFAHDTDFGADMEAIRAFVAEEMVKIR